MRTVKQALQAHWDAADTPLELEYLAEQLEEIAVAARSFAEAKRKLTIEQQPPATPRPRSWRQGRD